uniref:YbaK/prolyl-tRNA synthetase associated region n=1 Tax=Providencia alcalifaciens Ban1 TaxID=663916 RepID=C9E4H2_9GAMM|nr:YbaK/prolyl-tRNA synthetase associated region [Providencia alcalifaciens Ban1]
MSVERVRNFLKAHAPQLHVSELTESTATVSEAAKAFGVQPSQIAKTLSMKVNDDVLLIVMPGDAKLHNQKFKQQFGVKPRMLKVEEVAQLTGYQPGGVCPFDSKDSIRVYCDIGLCQHDEVLPAGGSSNSGVRISPQYLATICKAQWVDVSAV